MNSHFEYHKPDSLWEMFGCNTYPEYVNRYVTKGAFNESVPADIKKAYVTIEYLMAHAYYYWPMYDEALSKMLTTLEMAVKLKSKSAGIELTLKQGNKITNKSTYTLLRELNLHETNPDLYKRILVLKDIRNDKLHPIDHKFMGGLSAPVFSAFITYVNALFS